MSLLSTVWSCTTALQGQPVPNAQTGQMQFLWGKHNEGVLNKAEAAEPAELSALLTTGWKTGRFQKGEGSEPVLGSTARRSAGWLTVSTSQSTDQRKLFLLHC